MRTIDDKTLLEFREGRLVLIKSPTCVNCKLLFQRYPDLRELDFDEYTFDSNSSSAVGKFLEEKGVFAVPATILNENGHETVRTGFEVSTLAEYIEEVTRCS